jgi:hypothetical protein
MTVDCDASLTVLDGATGAVSVGLAHYAGEVVDDLEVHGQGTHTEIRAGADQGPMIWSYASPCARRHGVSSYSAM